MIRYKKALKIIANMKKDSFSSAMTTALPILNLENEIIGKLVPVGKWILPEDK